MLILMRRISERIRLKTASGEIIWLEVAGIDRHGGVKLAFTAPQSVEIMREEILNREDSER